MLSKLFGSKDQRGWRGPKSVQKLFEKGLFEPAVAPKDSAIDFKTLGDKKLYLFPIDHDYPGGSAAMHNAVFRAYGLPKKAAFVVADPANVEAIVDVLRADPTYDGGGAGSGFKDKVGPYLDRLDQSAEVIGAVNVIAREKDGLVGYNTDGIGFVLGLLAEYADAIAGKKVIILGAGGTALPISYEIAKKGPAEVVIVNRTVSKAQRIADLISPFVPASAVGEDQIASVFEGAGLVVNTSNKGASPNEAFSAFAPMTGDAAGDMKVSMGNLTQLPKDAIVADILLEPTTTTLTLAKEAGNRTHSGQHMNLYQAIPAFRIMNKLQDDDIRAIMDGVNG